jgi:endonuclease/exonuclease/phosphatase family metal-dependent hydrolase
MIDQPAEADMAMDQLRVVTLNLWNNDHLRYERAALVVEEMLRLRPHLIAFQEVGVAQDMASWIAERIQRATPGGAYRTFTWNKKGVQRTFEELAILACLPLAGPSEAVDLEGGYRVAQRITVRWQDTRIAFCNLHLHYPIDAGALRAKQARIASDWMEQVGDCIPLMVGDFNDVPSSEAMTYLLGAWASAYAAYHGKEPERTWPTPVDGGPEEPQLAATVDYVLFKPALLDVASARLCCHAGDATQRLYPSDHYGLVVDLVLR